MSRSKQIGTEWERRVRDYFRKRGWKAERLALAGVNDEGDLYVEHGWGPSFVVEAKAERAMDLSSYVREAEAEAAQYAKARDLGYDEHWIVVVKRRNQPVGKSYVVTTLDEFIKQVEA